MKKIRVLDDKTINKIAAGEVVERPSSIVKELVENSIDAGAASITIEIKDGGTSFIKVSDNGCGIAPSDVETAFIRYATNKIQSIDDLEKVISLGFRGEALASIAAVSQVEIVTKVKNNQTAVKLEIDGGFPKETQKTAANNGTSITVKNLFYNIPARRKFLKKPSTESGYISDVVNKIALAHPDIAIKYINNGVISLNTQGNNDLKTVVYNIYGKNVPSQMVEIDHKYKDLRVRGLIGKPELSRANRTYENIFINKRFVKNSVISGAAEEAYKTKIMSGKFPVFVLNVEIPPNMIDVNVHPSKLEVKFANESDVYKLIFDGINNTFKDISLIPKVILDESKSNRKIVARPKYIEDVDFAIRKEFGDQIPINSSIEEIIEDNFLIRKAGPEPPARPKVPPSKAMEKQLREESRRYIEEILSDEGNKELVDTINRTLINEQKVLSHEVDDTPIDDMEIPIMPILPTFKGENKKTRLREDWHKFDIDTAAPVRPEFLILEPSIEENEEDYDFRNVKDLLNGYNIIGQIFSTYWIIEHDDSLFIIDQHAAHERILYEELLKNLENDSIVSQKLVNPVVLELTENEGLLLTDYLDLFMRFGFEIELNRKGQFEIHSMPYIFKEPSNEAYFLDMLDRLKEIPINSVYDIRLNTVASMACKAAVKGNNKLHKSEARKVIEDLLELENPFTCPHGRPTVIELTKNEIEKKFKRKL